MAVKGGDLRYIQFLLESKIIITAVAKMRLQQRGIFFPQDFVKEGIIKIGALGIGALQEPVERCKVADEVRVRPGEDVKVLLAGGNDQGIKPGHLFELAVDPAPGTEQIRMKRMYNKLFHAVCALLLNQL
jgi:hypothetical protein